MLKCPNNDVVKLIDKLTDAHLKLVHFISFDFRYKKPDNTIETYEQLLSEQNYYKQELEKQGFKFNFEECLAVICNE